MMFIAVLGAQKPAPARLRYLTFTIGQYGQNSAVVPTSPARYDLPDNRLIFMQKNIRIVVATGVDRLDSAFEINGLANPDIQVVRGARVEFDCINLSPTGQQYFAIVSSPPPFEISDRPPPGVWSEHRRLANKLVPILPGREVFHAIADVVLSYQAETTGVAFYTGPEARAGLYGRIIVVP